ncbi:MAG TPA: hypothetical protein VGK25_03935 [Ignavibacteria bacterium]
MQTFLKVLGFITILLGIVAGIYVISDALSVYAAMKVTRDPYHEQVYLIKMIAGAAIIFSSVVSGMLYLSFGIVIELLDHINEQMFNFLEYLKKKKEPEGEEYNF